MICRNSTEGECLQRGLFGAPQSRLQYLSAIKKGDVGFLLNINRDQLLGVFIAEGPAKLNIEEDAWNRQFPAQVKVRPISSLQRIDECSKKLQNIVEMRQYKKEFLTYSIPLLNTFGPEITEKILALFDRPDQIRNAIPETEEIGIYPEYSLEDVAGLEEVKNFIYQRIIAPFEDEDRAFSLGLRVGGGVLLFGPPGRGKTLVAMSIARNIQAKFLDISPSVIVGYPGEAEKRLEKMFGALEKEPRAVVFLDEAEWILCKREEQNSSVMQRITPVLLAQLSKIFKQRKKQIIVIAATNKPEMIDTVFLRPGRFDKAFYAGFPNLDARKDLVKMQLRNRAHMVGEEATSNLAKELEGFSGADIETIVEEAAFRVFSRKNYPKPEITESDLLEVIKNTPKSVTPNDLQKIQEWAKGRGIVL